MGDIIKQLNRNIMFIGFMGVGKTTVSSYLGKALNVDVVEMDEIIACNEQLSIRAIFEKYGEDYFRSCETNTLMELKSRKKTLISCGGGIVLRRENLFHLRECGIVTLLTATPETIYKRVNDSTERPLLNNNMNIPYISRVMELREKKYLEAADIIVKTDDKTPPEICDELIKRLRLKYPAGGVYT